MKKNDIKELKNKPIGELEHIVKDSREKLRALRFDLAAGKVKNVYELHETRRRIARAQTFIKEQQNTVNKA